jgi:hypothetical protein
MDNPEILETLVTQETGHNVSSISGLSILDCRSVLSNVYLLPIVCYFSCVTNVSSISGLFILHCRPVLPNVYLLPIVCPVSCVTNELTIQRYWKHWSHKKQDIQ